MMNDFLKNNADIIIQVKKSDLMAFAEKLTKETVEEVEKRIKAENKPDELLTRQQVAALLGVTLTTLWHWEKKEILVPLKIGSKVRYRRSDVDKAMGKNK